MELKDKEELIERLEHKLKMFNEYSDPIGLGEADLLAFIRLLEQEQGEKTDIRLCEKCGQKYRQHLFKPLTICDDCMDKLSAECKELI